MSKFFVFTIRYPIPVITFDTELFLTALFFGIGSHWSFYRLTRRKQQIKMRGKKTKTKEKT